MHDFNDVLLHLFVKINAVDGLPQGKDVGRGQHRLNRHIGLDQGHAIEDGELLLFTSDN